MLLVKRPEFLGAVPVDMVDALFSTGSRVGAQNLQGTFEQQASQRLSTYCQSEHIATWYVPYDGPNVPVTRAQK